MRLRVRFPAPGWFLNDPRLTVRLGDRTLYDGSFKRGFDVSVEVEPGDHLLETAIHAPVGNGARRQRIALPLHDGGGYRDVPEVHAELSYSRLTGNFAERAALSTKR
jgi:hypothetical protein